MARKPETCGTCRFARPIPDNTEAIICQRHPPKVLGVVCNTVNSHWPLLGTDKWCGEYKRKTGE